MTDTTIPATLPVVAWRCVFARTTGVFAGVRDFALGFTDKGCREHIDPDLIIGTEGLTPQAPAQEALEALRDDRDSWRDQASARAADAVQFANERDAARAEVSRLTAERDAAREDARRWHALRDILGRGVHDADGMHYEALDNPFDERPFAEQFDAFADAAMNQETK